MGWLFLSIAIIFEVCGTTCMKLSQGYTKLLPSVLIFVFYGLSFTVFPLALKHIDLSLSYSVWAGLGVLLIGIIGVVYFKESVTALKVTSMALIVAGVAGLYGSMAIHS